jgi:Rad3-related DNA helicase
MKTPKIVSIPDSEDINNKKETVKDYFSKIPNFENRDNQISMAEKIYNNFFSNQKTTIEAPT